MHITGGTRYQRLLKQGRLRRRKVATNEDPTNAQPVRNIACPGEELKLMFIFASSITKVIKTPISPRGMASTKQTTRASTGDLAATGESTQSVFIAVSKVSFLSRTIEEWRAGGKPQFNQTASSASLSLACSKCIHLRMVGARSIKTDWNDTARLRVSPPTFTWMYLIDTKWDFSCLARSCGLTFHRPL